MKIIEVDNLTLRFGGLTAIDDVSFYLKEGEILSAIGPNGAGKTSLFNVITGLYTPSRGELKVHGQVFAQTIPGYKVILATIISVIMACFAVITINAQEIWSAMISDRYIYQEPFDYAASLSAGKDFLLGLNWTWSWGPWAVVFVLCLMAFWQFEHSARISPLVASRHGLARTFQNLRLLSSATVAENVKTAARRLRKPGFLSVAFGLKSSRAFERDLDAEVVAILKDLDLESLAQERVGSLSYGTQRRVEIARALATQPKVLLLDEPAAGLNQSESNELLETIRKISQSGITIFLIEHDMSVVMSISDRIIVLHHGEKLAEGSPQEIKTNPEVIKAYLGNGGK